MGVFALVAVMLSGSANMAAAQTPRDGEWDMFVAPYLMGAAMSGATTVRGVEVDVDVSASDIFSNLLNYATGEDNEEFRYDVLTQGPVFGLGLRF